jgi:hypothetical protein
MERAMFTKSIDVTEPSYFNFVMAKRGFRRTVVPFAVAAGMLPELARDYRAVTATGVRSL